MESEKLQQRLGGEGESDRQSVAETEIDWYNADDFGGSEGAWNGQRNGEPVGKNVEDVVSGIAADGEESWWMSAL